MKARRKPLNIYQIKITLKYIRPPIWRRILLADNTSLLDLHKMIQKSFGWSNYHLHRFEIDESFFSNPEISDKFDEYGIIDEEQIYLQDLNLKKGHKFLYEYDFGDSWYHILLVEKELPFDKEMELPCCIKGKRACPPEDIGGRWGYEYLLEVINDPENEDYKKCREWVGDDFDPEAIDLEKINNGMQGKTKYW